MKQQFVTLDLRIATEQLSEIPVLPARQLVGQQHFDVAASHVDLDLAIVVVFGQFTIQRHDRNLKTLMTHGRHLLLESHAATRKTRVEHHLPKIDHVPVLQQLDRADFSFTVVSLHARLDDHVVIPHGHIRRVHRLQLHIAHVSRVANRNDIHGNVRQRGGNLTRVGVGLVMSHIRQQKHRRDRLLLTIAIDLLQNRSQIRSDHSTGRVVVLSPESTQRCLRTAATRQHVDRLFVRPQSHVGLFPQRRQHGLVESSHKSGRVTQS